MSDDSDKLATLADIFQSAQIAIPPGADDVYVRVSAAQMGQSAQAWRDEDAVWNVRYPNWIAGAMRASQWIVFRLADEGCHPAKTGTRGYTPAGYARQFPMLFERRGDDVQIQLMGGWLHLLDVALNWLRAHIDEHGDSDRVRVRGVRVTSTGLRILLSEWPSWAFELAEKARVQSLTICQDCGGIRKSSVSYGIQCDMCYFRVQQRGNAPRLRTEDVATGIIRGLLIGDPVYRTEPRRWCIETRDGGLFRIDTDERIVTRWAEGRAQSWKFISVSDPQIGERVTIRISGGVERVGAREINTSEVIALWREA